MSDDREELLAQDSTPEYPRSRRGQSRRHQRSVFQYIAILFAAALVLLLYTFMMERRQYEQLQKENRENATNLEQSVSAVQRLQGLYNENDALKEQVASLEETVARLEDQIGALQRQSDGQQEQLDRTARAMDWFWQINEAYVRGRNNKCRELIASLEQAGLADALPRESATDNDRFSPADRYQEIYDKVMN